MKVLVTGEDGRAHAFVWKLFDSPQTTEIICAPGNGGTSQLVPSIDLRAHQVAEIARWSFEEHVDLIVPASSDALYAGLVDEVVSMQMSVCGPSQRSTHLMQSRCQAKDFLLRHALPTPQGKAFRDLATAEKYLAIQPLPIVIKADHPAVGGGTFSDRYTALTSLRHFFASHPVEGHNDGVVIEAFTPGVHISFSALTDGDTTVPLLPTRIYSRYHEGENARYAPGMGAHTGSSAYVQRLTTFLHQQRVAPLVAALKRDDLPYWGVIGIDCVITPQGPLITGLRCSLRDMEAQVVLPRLHDDLLPVLQATMARRLDRLPALTWRDEVSVGIALVAHGYPHHFPVGSEIHGLTTLEPGVLVFHDQTYNPLGLEYKPVAHRGPDALAKLLMGRTAPGDALTTTGGHVLTVVAMGATLNGARGRAMLNAERITFTGRFYRDDIGTHEFRR
jgi:phosphoribosylamine--glycine ligase